MSAPGAERDATLPHAAALLAADGPIAARLDGFQVRPEQQEMADEIAAVLAAREVLVCEAGTGTGKTLAYLVPALISGLKTVISTATRTLQDQLFHRDLPLVREALGRGHEVALLKGRANYLCLYRLERTINDPLLDHRRQPLLGHLRGWAGRTASGDLEEVGVLDDDPAIRASITSTTENCLGQDCPVYDRCFVVKARRAAAGADLVVVNHHLLCADMVLRETGFAELLPSAEAVIVDEAHKLPDIASMFFSRSVSAQQLSGLARDVVAAARLEAPDTPDLLSRVEALERSQLALRERLRGHGARPDFARLRSEPAIAGQIAAVGEALAACTAALVEVAERGEELDSCHERAATLLARWRAFDAEAESGHVHWIDISARNFTVYDTPISVAGEFSARLAQSEAAWVMTSATLAMERRFDHFTAALGIGGAHERLWASPFDYPNCALLFVPPMRAEPRSADYERELVEIALPVLRASRGRAFFLFTSYRALGVVADLLAAQDEFPLLVQGQAPRSELLRRFELAQGAVLLGTASFWEGVDVRGEQLSCVIIDKLPFGVPDDPVTRARSEALVAAGGNPFMALQLPEAVTALKQGAGRLIRDVADRGVLMIADNRIRTRAYGRVFLNSLPPMRLTDSLAEVQAFFEE